MAEKNELRMPRVVLSERIHWMPAEEVILPKTQLIVESFSMGLAQAKGLEDQPFVSLVVNNDLALCLGSNPKTLQAMADMIGSFAEQLRKLRL